MEKINLGKQIGFGVEKSVHRDPENPDKVIGVYHKGIESGRVVRARFYLTKILHLLFPKNIPDIQASYSNPNIVKRSRVTPDELHKTIEKVRKMEFRDKTVPKDLIREDVNARRKIAWDQKVEIFTKHLRELGIDDDYSVNNFTYDEDGNPVWLDTVDPWYSPTKPRLQERTDSLELNFNISKLREAIGRLEDNKKEEALTCLDRLTKLVEEESSFLTDSR